MKRFPSFAAALCLFVAGVVFAHVDVANPDLVQRLERALAPLAYPG